MRAHISGRAPPRKLPITPLTVQVAAFTLKRCARSSAVLFSARKGDVETIKTAPPAPAINAERRARLGVGQRTKISCPVIARRAPEITTHLRPNRSLSMPAGKEKTALLTEETAIIRPRKSALNPASSKNKLPSTPYTC